MRPLNQEAVQKISSGQVITCVLDVIKELIENSLDAQAKTIKIKIEDQGLQSITVVDDGTGITQEGRETCGHAYTTSKITEIDDLRNQLTTYGFRGEAIHSLCVLGDVTITTRCADEDQAIKMKFNHDGIITSKEKTFGIVGTTVVVEHILSDYPVRIREERTNFSADGLKNLLSNYFLAAPTVRFVVDAPPYVTLTRPPLSNLMQAVKYEFGASVVQSMSEKTVEGYSGDIRIRMKAILPSMNCVWKDASTSRMQPRQYLFVNGRPVRNSPIEKKINEAYWKKYGNMPKRLARYVLCIDYFRETNLCSTMFDVNKDPSKSRILFSQSESILKMIDEILSFSEKKIKPHRMKDWPSREIKFDSNDITVKLESLGSNIWTDSGIFGDSSLFTVTDFTNKKYLVKINTAILLEVCGVNRNEVGRTEQSELLVNFWDQLIEKNEKETCISIVGQI